MIDDPETNEPIATPPEPEVPAPLPPSEQPTFIPGQPEPEPEGDTAEKGGHVIAE